MRVLAIDLGSVRTGLALSDVEGVTCSPLPPIVERDRDKTLLRVASVIEERQVTQVVVGLPRPLRAGTNEHVQQVLDFVERLRGSVQVPVVTWDERFTSKLAEKARSTRASLDSVAACYILQDYLDSLRNQAAGREGG